MDVYNAAGEKVASLMNNTLQEAGSHTFNYTLATPGIYFLRLISGNESFTKKVLIIE